MRFRYEHSLKVVTFMERDQAEDSQTSVAALCEALDDFTYLPYYVLGDERDEEEDSDTEQYTCTCNKDAIKSFFKSQTEWAQHEMLGIFQGLCLDCMYTSFYRDDHYWRNGSQHRFDEGCSIRHHRLTWFFSYMGEPEPMRRFLEEEGFEVDSSGQGFLPLEL
jgi:hypothetical protein